MKRSLTCLAVALASLGLLGACGERREGGSVRKSDTAAATGATPGYTVSGWKKGDAASWEQQIRTRTQNQNEYLKTTAASR